MNLELDMSREYLIHVISTLYSISREFFYEGCKPLGPFNQKHPRETAVLDSLSFELYKNIRPTKEEWSKTEFFKKYFTEEAKKNFLRNE